MADATERLHRLHGTLLGETPQETQAHLYRSFPSVLGFSSKENDEVKFEAALILALLQAGKVDGEKELHKVYFLVPSNIADGWVLAKFRATAKRIFERLKGGKSVPLVKHIGELFHQVMLGSQVFTLPREPDRWVAFGFAKTDQIPDWMRAKLLELPETQPDSRLGV